MEATSVRLISNLNTIDIACVAVSIALVTVVAFQWQLVDILTPFLLMPLKGFLWFLFIFVLAWRIWSWQTGWCQTQSMILLFFCLSCGLAAWFDPFTNVWLRANFRWYQMEREAVVRSVLQGSLRPNVSYNPNLIALQASTPTLSMGGNEIVVEEHNGQQYVLFFTFRGILDNYSGFLFVPVGGNPRLFSDLDRKTAQLHQIGEHWFYVSYY